MKQAAEGKLPNGHPKIPGQGPIASPTTQPLLPTLFIEAQQGTAGGPAIGADPVTIELYRGEERVYKLDTRLDANGKLTATKFPVLDQFEPVIKLTHGGVEYSARGNAMDMEHTAQTINLTVYESTDVQPAWRIKVRQVMVTTVAGGVTIMEMMNVENPTDRAWIGTPGPDGKRVTLSLPIPKDATDLKVMAGLAESSVSVVNNQILSSAAVLPGALAMQLHYHVPTIAGKVDLLVNTPSPIERMMLFVPDDGTTVVPTNLESLGSKPNDRGTSTRYYKGQSLQAGASTGVTLANLPLNAKAEGEHVEETVAPGKPQASGGATPQVIGGIGAVAILFVGAAILLKPKRN